MRICDISLIIGGNSDISSILHQLNHLLYQIIQYNENENKFSDFQSIIQSDKNPSFSCLENIPVLTQWICLNEFDVNYYQTDNPVICRGFMNHWKAFENSNWKNINYWKKNYGRRTIPVEIGNDYRLSNWKTSLITINQFIDDYILNSLGNEIGYFAQSQIFEWIPKLRSDIAVPDYIGDHDEIINIWFVCID